jgi:hypothetical protein
VYLTAYLCVCVKHGMKVMEWTWNTYSYLLISWYHSWKRTWYESHGMNLEHLQLLIDFLVSFLEKKTWYESHGMNLEHLSATYWFLGIILGKEHGMKLTEWTWNTYQLLTENLWKETTFINHFTWYFIFTKYTWNINQLLINSWYK